MTDEETEQLFGADVLTQLKQIGINDLLYFQPGAGMALGNSYFPAK